MELLAILGLSVLLVAAGATMATALFMVRRPIIDGTGLALSGWLACESAAVSETELEERELFARRLRTRVPPALRLRYEEHVVEPEIPAADELSAAR
jgi:hypothetical protein